jgi:AraC-like DNA-binding protein
MRAADAAAFLAEPVGRYVDATAFVVWAQHPTRIGLFHTAAFVDHADRAAIEALAPVAVSPALAARYDAIHDAGALASLDEGAFAFVERFMARRAATLAVRVRRLAVVAPTGYAGAAFNGIFERWIRPHLDATLCATRAAAYDFLAVDAADRAALDALTAGAGAGDPLRRVRDALARDLVAATIERLADQLATSVRSLQRQLGASGTSFRAELERARVHAAQARLRETDDKLDAIAADVGIGSASALVRLFERATGVAPGEFRRRAQAEGRAR